MARLHRVDVVTLNGLATVGPRPAHGLIESILHNVTKRLEHITRTVHLVGLDRFHDLAFATQVGFVLSHVKSPRKARTVFYGFYWRIITTLSVREQPFLCKKSS